MNKQPNPSAFEYDLFISYSQADHEWVEGYLLDALNAAHVHVLSELNFALGMPRISEFERAIKSSKRTLLVLSPAYMAEGALEFVDAMVQAYGLESGTWPVIPLLLKPVELPPRLAFLVPLNATDPQQWAGAVARLCDALQTAPPAPATRPSCPYPGMRAFREQETTYFHGREAEVEELLQRLRRHPFVAVIGPSGSGKSSLLNAGLIPALRRSTLFGPGDWLVRVMRPGVQPMAELVETLRTDDIQQFIPTTLFAAQPGAMRLLVVIDQFEEVFTQGSEQMQAFFAAIQRLMALRACFVVVTVRADFFADLLTSPLWPIIQAHRLEIAHLGEQGLRTAIVKPAEDVGVFIESALVERLVASSAGQPGLLPFVQEVMVRLWEKLERRFLPLRAYEALVLPLAGYSGSERSGIQAAMALVADEIIHSLSPDQQRIAQRIFLRLVQFGEGRDDTRRQQPVSALSAVGDDEVLFDRTLDYLVENRLLVLSGEEDGERRVDLAHEAMLKGWPMLGAWTRQHKAAELMRRGLEAKAAEWVRLGSGESALLDKAELSEAESWLDEAACTELAASADLLALIAASKAAINPGWNRRGAVLLAAGAVASTALIALLPLISEHWAWPLRAAAILATVVVVVLTLWTTGLLRRGDAFRFQRWSHTVVHLRPISVFLSGLFLLAVAAWSVFGVSRVRTIAYCRNQGYDASRDISAHVALLGVDVDPYYLRLVTDELNYHPEIVAWIVSMADSEQCENYFTHVVEVEQESPPGGREVGFGATVHRSRDGSSNHVPVVRHQAQCDMFVELGQKVINQCDVEQQIPIYPLEERPHIESCQAFALNQDGWSLFQNGAYEQAASMFQAAIDLEPDFAVAYNNLGLVYLQTKYYAKALELFFQAVELWPDNSVFLLDVGVAYRNLGDDARSEAKFQEVIELEKRKPTLPQVITEAWNNLGALYRDEERFEESDTCFIAALESASFILSSDERQKRELEVRKNQGILRAKQEKWQESIRLLTRVDEVGQSRFWEEEIVFYLALAYEMAGDPAFACDYWMRYRDLVETCDYWIRYMATEPSEDSAALRRRAKAKEHLLELACTETE